MSIISAIVLHLLENILSNKPQPMSSLLLRVGAASRETLLGCRKAVGAWGLQSKFFGFIGLKDSRTQLNLHYRHIVLRNRETVFL